MEKNDFRKIWVDSYEKDIQPKIDYTNWVRVSGFIQDIAGAFVERVAVFKHISLLAFNREENGIYSIWIPPGSNLVTFYHPGYMPQTVNITTYKNNTMIMNVTLLEIKSYSIDASKGGIITDSLSQTKFTVPEGALIYGDGSVCSGQAQINIGYLNASNPAHWGSMPGGYQGYLADGTFGIFHSYGAYYFEFYDASGKPLYFGVSQDKIIDRLIASEKCRGN